MNNPVLPVIVLENLTDHELLKIANDLQSANIGESGLLKRLAKQFFGGESLMQILFVAHILLPVIAERMKQYSPELDRSLIKNLAKVDEKIIQTIISDYDRLKHLAANKLKVLSSISMDYCTYNGIDEILIDELNVYVKYSHDIYEDRGFQFPTEWLSKSDDELVEIVKHETRLKAEHKEKREREQYERLKTKYEKN